MANQYVFKKYNKFTNLYEKDNIVNLDFVLGSHINGRYPHHAGGNQQIEIKGAIAKARINYKYGFLKSISSNKYLTHTGIFYNNWTVLEPSLVILDPLKNQGLISLPIDGNGGGVVNPLPILKSEDLALTIGTTLNIRLKVQKTNVDEYYYDPYSDESFLPFFVQRFKIVLSNGATTYTLKKFGEDYSWDLTTQTIDLQYTEALDYTVPTPPLPINGNVYIILYQNYVRTYRGAEPAPESTNAEVTMVDFINTSNPDKNVVGDFHTAQRKNKPSSIAQDTSTIYNGDSPSLVYEGAIFKNDQITPTIKWNRKGITESKAILQIAVEDILRISQSPAKVFNGDVYGFVPYLSIISIDSINGKFMPIEWSFNTLTNTTSLKLLEGFTDELNDIDYKYTLDYGQTTKPTITS